jgi:hypothetical protein
LAECHGIGRYRHRRRGTVDCADVSARRQRLIKPMADWRRQLHLALGRRYITSYGEVYFKEPPMSLFAAYALFGMPVIAVMIGFGMVYITDPKRNSGKWF